MDDHSAASALGFGLVMFTQVCSVVAKQIRSGGSYFSHLDKTVEIPVNKVNLEFTSQVVRQRLASLGFQALDDGNNFIQGGADIAELGSSSHAKTKKMLALRFQDSGPDQVLAVLQFRYLDLIVVDTGESAYRDAVLDFVSGKADQMITVPNESLMAMNSLIGGALACITAALLILLNKLDFWPVIPIVAVTEFAVGMLALATIMRKPDEITGRWKAVIGIILSVTAIGISLFFIIATRSSSS